MPEISIDVLTLHYEAEDQDAVEPIRLACEKSIRLMQEHWGLRMPEDCRVYIMTSWLGFVFRSAPWPWKILLGVTMPLWAGRAKRIWPLAGGWAQRYGRRRAVGVKPPRLLQLADRKIGERIFVQERDVGEKVQSITCHELTHAFTSHLRLPTWLREGLAMVMVDAFFERPTVQSETLEALERSSGRHGAGDRQKLRIADEEALVYVYVRAYWLTKYLDETRPGLLRDLLSRRFRPGELEDKIAASYGMIREEFWSGIDAALVSHFKGSGQPA